MKSAARLSERLYGILLGLRSRINLNGKSGTFLYAVCAGVLAAIVATVFQKSTQFILATLTGTEGGRFVATFQQIPDWRKIFALAVGGAISGLILLFASQKVKKKATPYMEAVAIGNGYIPVRPNLLRSLAAIITIGSGASIGREGPLVQTVTVFASLFGRKMNVPLPRLRLLIACAAAGGMSAVFHTPLAGGLFVCEIVIGVMSIDILAPLLVSSCASYITIMTISNPAPLYEISRAYLSQEVSIAFYALLLGILSSLLAKMWLAMLNGARKTLNGNPYWLPARLALAGVIVGSISIYYPEVVGNGAHIIRGIVSMDFSAEQILVFTVLKISCVALFFGMGAVGGVLTPSLTIGSIFGFLFANALMSAGVPLSPEEVIGFSLLGMAAFFTTAAAAPITSLMLVLEFTLAGRMIFPLIIGVLTSYAVSKMTGAKSMYSSALAGNVMSAFNRPIAEVKLRDIFRKNSDTVMLNETFGKISKRFLATPDEAVFVASRTNKYLGAIFRSDILSFLKSDYVSNVIAEDIMRTDLPKLSPETPLIDAIKTFSEISGEILPIVDASGKFYGTVYKSDILMGFAEVMRRERVRV